MNSPLLEKISQPSDLKKLSSQQTVQLCAEIREFLLDNVSKTGGHLASNLGAVELTVALHRVLTTPTDEIVFDVGHQCYTHKLLTGRREGFAKLRQLDGISGFPNPNESEHDAFIAGHGNTALSLAVGIAWAKKLRGEPGQVVALIGDGAFTGGMVYEGIINSMTPLEREKPEIIDAKRRERLAKGSGTTMAEVNKLMKQFEDTHKMMKAVAGGNMKMPKLPGRGFRR